MHLDVLDLRKFYYRTRLGRIAQRAVRERVAQIWPSLPPGSTVVGFGFAAPLLRPYLDTARRVVCLMPAEQGVMAWPEPVGPEPLGNVSALCDEAHWPLGAGAVDRLLCLHGLETSETPSRVLEEAARVLSPGGRALFIVPNRAGLWARRDATPFGFGRPYSIGQIEQQLKRHKFVPEGHYSALFVPPSQARFWLKSAGFLERVGRRLPALYTGGVVIVEASKQVFAPTRPGLAERVSRPLKVLEGVPQPVGATGRAMRNRPESET
ncbi:MAG: methyltransferase domain-containing protein [Pseudomonadota bacterium]